MNRAKQYWVRLVHADRPCTELDKTRSLTKAYDDLRKGLKMPDVRFGYVMTTDAFGECFLDLLRKESVESDGSES